MDLTKRSVDPLQLAIATRPQPFRQTSNIPTIWRPGLQGFWSDLWDKGQQAINDWANTQFTQSGTSAHIAAQNQAVAEMGAVLDSVHRGTMSNALAQQQIQSISSSFTAFCQRLGYPEALAGATDVARLAAQIISDLKRDALNPTGTTAGTILGFSTPIAVGLGILAFMFLRRR